MADPIDLVDQAFKQPTIGKIREAICNLLESKKIDYSDLGYFIAEKADGFWGHPHLPMGIAYIAVGDGVAFVTEWNDDVFDFYETTVSKAENNIQAKEKAFESDLENWTGQQPICGGN